MKANLQLCEAQPDLSGNPFLRIHQVLFKLKSSAKKIDFVTTSLGLGALRQAQDKLQAD
ncbi:hypothetical protein [Epilithonimonas vandammei]|uniref:hypothetical protein n=1 Tax=Epilithonimonas vandammei TaxID=2487072 RepID=UPI00289EE456|nr:hypothetical protein [Epilithonimonas vandammei]